MGRKLVSREATMQYIPMAETVATPDENVNQKMRISHGNQFSYKGKTGRRNGDSHEILFWHLRDCPFVFLPIFRFHAIFAP